MTTYTIKAGDTLWAIGRNVVGLNWRFIASLNRSTISDPNKIYVGQKITIPNPTLVYWLSEFADIVLAVVGGWKINVAIAILRFIVQAGSFKKQDVTTFCIQQGVDAIFAAKMEVLYRTIGPQGFVKIYQLWMDFWNYGINKIIDKS